MKSLVILGSGGYAQEVLWVVDDINKLAPTWEFLGFVDPAAAGKKGQLLYDRPILGGFADAEGLPGGVFFACGIGRPSSRQKECQEAERLGWRAVSLIHPTVTLARHVQIGEGTIVGAGSIIAPYAVIGRHCALNLHVTVGHNSWVGDYCVLSPGARVSGGAVLEERVFLGTNATVYLERRMGAGGSLAANSFLVTDLEPEASAIGIPARTFAKATGAGICEGASRGSW